jgi:transcriptional regulator with XRE-family HTH domain
MNMSELSDNLKHEMALKGWNAYDLEKHSGVPQPTIHRILSGKHSDPRSKTVKKLAAGLGISEFQLRGETVANTTIDVNQSLPLPSNANDQPFKSVKEPVLTKLPIVPWHKLSLFLNSTVNIEEFETMPSTKKYNKDAFYLRAEDDLYAPYLKSGELALVLPSSDTLGKRVIVEMNDNCYIMDHCILERECFLPKREGARQIDITDNLNYRIHGVIEEIITIRKG